MLGGINHQSYRPFGTSVLCQHADHGLTPMATPFRSVGTDQSHRVPRAAIRFALGYDFQARWAKSHSPLASDDESPVNEKSTQVARVWAITFQDFFAVCECELVVLHLQCFMK